MPLRIDRVDADMDIVPESRGEPPPPAAGIGESDSALRERLRPIVLQILEQELDRLRRERG